MPSANAALRAGSGAPAGNSRFPATDLFEILHQPVETFFGPTRNESRIVSG